MSTARCRSTGGRGQRRPLKTRGGIRRANYDTQAGGKEDHRVSVGVGAPATRQGTSCSGHSKVHLPRSSPLGHRRHRTKWIWQAMAVCFPRRCSIPILQNQRRSPSRQHPSKNRTATPSRRRPSLSVTEVLAACTRNEGHKANVGAFINRIRCWGPLYYKYNKEPRKYYW